jgi:hypothetical protein
MGLDGFAWWFGVIENRKDPLSLGRCQVRIFGWHTEDKNQIPSKDLPWAHPILPISTNTGTVTSAKEGDMVFGFFLDSDDGQFPVMMGIVPGIPEFTPRIDKGFSDQRDATALSSSPRTIQSKTYNTDSSGVSFVEGQAQRYPTIVNEPTTSRLARNENVDQTIVGEKNQTVVKNVLGASENYWSEPKTKYAAVYPYNHVYESESGHVMEMDDTPGAERIHVAHRSGTFDEIHPDGTRVTKIVKDKYEIVLSDNNVLVYGDCSITINGRGSIFVRGDADLKVGGSMTTSVQGSYEVVSTGNMKFIAPRIDFNPPGESPVYIEQTYDPKLAVIEKRQVPGGTGSFVFAGVTLNVDPDYASKSNDYVSFDSPKDTSPEAANTVPSPPVTCGDFSEPLTEADYNKNLSANYKLRDYSISCLFPYRINAQKGLKESEIACNLQALSENCIEPLRQKYPGFRINSGYRAGESQSQHGTGQAADIQWPGISKAELFERCKWASENLPFDRIIYEAPQSSSSGWMHISFNRSGNLKLALSWFGVDYKKGLVSIA